MRLKKLGAALFVVVALGVIAASSAFAAATTTDVKWYTGTSPGTELSGTATVAAASLGSLTWDFELFGTEVSFKVGGLECVECKIENSGGTAVGSGKLKFTGVTVEKPANCTTASTITTKALSWQADWMIETTDYWRIVPTAGEEAGFATIELGGASCPLRTAIVLKGSLFVQVENATGVQAAEQTVSSSAAINSTAGGFLHLGSEAASLTGTAKFTIAGGVAFGTH